MREVVAVILAGGRGKRMNILCHSRAKPSLFFAGKLRVIDFTLSNCLHSGIHSIGVLTDYQRAGMWDYLEEWRMANTNGNSVTTLEPEVSYKGTADAVYQNIAFLKKYSADTVLVLAADHVYRMDYRKMLAFHDSMRADVTVGVVEVPIEQANRFGIVMVNEAGQVTDFVEIPRVPRSNLSSMGIYVFRKDVLIQRLEEDARNESSSHDFGHAIMPSMVNSDRVYAYRFGDYWRDIGSVEAYYEANMELTGDMPSLSLNGHWPVLGQSCLLPPPRIASNDLVKGSIISPGCIIEGQVRNSVLSPGVKVGKRATIRDSIIMANCSIDTGSVIENSILDEQVQVGRFCYVGFGSSMPHSSITVLGRNVVVPDGTAIIQGCRVRPDVGPTDFPSSAIRAGEVVSQRSSPAVIRA